MVVIKKKSLTFSKIKIHPEILCVFFLIFFMVAENPKTTFSQSQLDPQSAINSLCNMVQDNRLIVGFIGLDQAINICSNINSLGANQALIELCNVVSGIKIINVDPYCDIQAEQSGQNQSGNNTASTLTNSNNNNPEANSSGSITDRLFSFLFGQFGL
jgi:hypothetical protein